MKTVKFHDIYYIRVFSRSALFCPVSSEINVIIWLKLTDLPSWKFYLVISMQRTSAHWCNFVIVKLKVNYHIYFKIYETKPRDLVRFLSRDIDAKDVCTLMQLCDIKAEGKLLESIQNLNFRIHSPSKCLVRVAWL